MSVGAFRGCSRGVFGLSDWNIPLRRPGALAEGDCSASSGTSASQPPTQAAAEPTVGDWQLGQKLMVKYSYTAQTDSPLGEPELTVQQKDEVFFVGFHPMQKLWVKVRHDGGAGGYIPASYVTVLEDKVSSLPWLQNTPVEVVPQEKPEWKPYKSAYAPKEEPAKEEQQRYYCEICAKEFNGPKPFASHMASKAHKEEVEAQMD